MSQLKILIAEDEEVTRQLFAIGFRDQQFATRIVDNGEDALISYKSWQPDIILLDIMMPQMNGFQTLQVIRKDLNDTATTVIMVSSVADKKEILACATMGIHGYILKPFSTKTLAATVVACHLQKKNKCKASATRTTG